MVDRIVIVSDCTDIAFAEMRGSILRSAHEYAPGRPLHIEPLAPVTPFSVLNAGFTLRLMAEAYPTGTLLMFIMNSIRERTERIVGRTKTGVLFEGTNTGAAGWLVEDLGVEECYELHDPGFVPFGGKFVHAPAVGRLAAGCAMSELGNPFPAERIRRTMPGDGVVVHVDNFGNAKLPLRARFEIGQPLVVTLPDGRRIDAVYGRRMMEHEDGTWVVYPGSSFDLHEVGEVRGAGVLRFGVGPGDALRVEARAAAPAGAV